MSNLCSVETSLRILRIHTSHSEKTKQYVNNTMTLNKKFDDSRKYFVCYSSKTFRVNDPSTYVLKSNSSWNVCRLTNLFPFLPNESVAKRLMKCASIAHTFVERVHLNE